MGIKIVAAVAQNGVIGKEGGIPFLLPDDLRRFKEITMGHPVVMGSKTFASLLNTPLKGPLPGRENIVLTRHPEKLSEWAVTTVADFNDVVERSRSENLFVVGGTEPYRLALPHADTLYITRVHAKVDGDTFFPEWNESSWQKVSSERRSSNERNKHSFTWEVWFKKKKDTEPVP